jgi:hypothetical protein
LSFHETFAFSPLDVLLARISSRQALKPALALTTTIDRNAV